MNSVENQSWIDFLYLTDQELMEQCVLDKFRASGPGGQKKNKTDSAVRIRHVSSGLVGFSSESRSQHINRVYALRRLRLKIALTLRSNPPNVRSELEKFVQQTKNSSFTLNTRNSKYSIIVASLFDELSANNWKVSLTAKKIGVTSSSLNKFLRSNPELWRALNNL
ncbi:MAG: hypothetical protein CL792_03215 [Chloroflexi bacterium]|nr:hypothetical protein [Chloroflexota bacterium]|tara:strand:- start:764 stop:1261 length:498 start_codon:yes stop_codon:yes gene_type:complete